MALSSTSCLCSHVYEVEPSLMLCLDWVCRPQLFTLPLKEKAVCKTQPHMQQHHHRPCVTVRWVQRSWGLAWHSRGCLLSTDSCGARREGEKGKGGGTLNWWNSSTLFTLDTESQGRNLEIGIKEVSSLRNKGFGKTIWCCFTARGLSSLKPKLLQIYSGFIGFLVSVFGLFLCSSCLFWRR